MTTTSIGAVFFDSPDGTARALTEALRSTDSAGEIRDGLGRAAGTAKDAVLDTVGSAAGEILEMSVGAIFERSWSKYRALVEAAEETAGDPESVRLIGLVTHDVSVDYEPRVEVYLNDRRIATIPIRLELTLTLRGVLVHVQDGCVTGIRAGDCVVKGALFIGDEPVADGERTFDLARDVLFVNPIRLAVDGRSGARAPRPGRAASR